MIGKPCKDVSEAEALDYVLGYCTGNDVSEFSDRTSGLEIEFAFVIRLRCHSGTTRWLSRNGASLRVLVTSYLSCDSNLLITIPKPSDNSTPIGPVIVAAKAIPNPQTLPLKTVVNGATLQDGTTAYVPPLLSGFGSILMIDKLLFRDQIFNVRQTIAWLSQGTTLEPGSIIMTGTPKGVGFVRKPPIYLKHGDEVRVWIGGGLGTLINPVVEEGKATGAKAKL